MGHARVFIDHGFQWDGSQNVWITRARASYVLEAGPVFDIKPRALLARVTGFFGGASSGDPCFDNFFSVKTAAPMETWRALTTRTRSLLAGAFEDARLISDGRMVTLWREGDAGREADGVAAAEAVAEIVMHGSEVLERIESLPSAQPYGARGPWHDRRSPGVVLRVPSPVCVAPTPGARGAVLSTWSPCGRIVEPFAVVVDEHACLHGNVDRIPEHTRLASDVGDAIGACAIACDGRRVVLRWGELDVARERLVRGTRLVAELSRLSTGLYR